MTTDQTHELDTDRARILSRLVDINAKVADLTGEAESLKAELRGLPAGDYAVNGMPALRVIPTRKFDAAAAAQALPEVVRSSCLTVSYDATKVRAQLTPAQVDTFMVEAGKPKIVML